MGGPSNIYAGMLSSTTSGATPRVLLRKPLAREHGRIHGAVQGRAPAEGPSSPAGLHRRPWLARLREAVAEDSFVLHFQPIVSLQDGSVTHHEALLRLADLPDGSLIAPGAFLPAAERYGLIRELDRMVLCKVAEILGGVQAGSGVSIAINLSALSVTDADMLAYLASALDRAGADPAQLMVEVTETAAISDMASARDFCAGVLSLGCGVALDDFGAGFGSFQYLKHLPFSHLKIDGDFIRGLPGSPTDQLVVPALAGVVRGMGRQTIAEFVGDNRTMTMLREYGVDYAQGFHVGRPMPAIPALV
jgi:EAL domain-containing protein (putative c-di-GMP-specific phosphodiesterase class I)